MGLHHKIVDSIDYQEQLELKDASETLRIIKSSGLSGGNNDNKNFVLNNITGRDVFRDKYYLLSKAINKKIETFELPDSYTFTSIRDGIEPFELNHVKTTFEPIFFNHYNAVKTDFGHYFRNLYRIVKFVDESILISDDEIEFKKTVSNDDKREILAEENFKLKYSYTSMLRAQLSDYELGWIFYNCISSNGSKKFMPLINKYAILKNLNWLDYHPNYICIYQKTAYINPLES